MDGQFVPRIACRFRIREDIDCFLGFFQGRGVLAFNAVGAFIVGQMTGDKNLGEIAQSVKDAFPEAENPLDEVLTLAHQLQESEFF